ncbi:MAG: excinuclease ABC subunit UvrB [Bdellovibrionaceae bacterium]|nr:excinuclease ABC subunit UvrB [Pseudobdellovibrionaceae bacterium]
MPKNNFKLHSEYKPAGDQVKAIKQINSNIKSNIKEQTLLGVTGSGKTFTMANIIEKTNIPSLILAPNKTLAAQLYEEFKNLFPENAVEYFVSYYDYYQPEAYMPTRDLFIEKDSSINEQIDLMRHSATHSLLARRDVLIISSVSCIYGLGSPEVYEDMVVQLEVNQKYNRNDFLKELIRIQYNRSDNDFHRGTFRVRGDVVDVFLPYDDQKVVRVEFFGDFIESLSLVAVFGGKLVKELDKVAIYPASHHVTNEEKTKKAKKTIEEELKTRIKFYKEQMHYTEMDRIEKRTEYDLELMQEMGFCPGIENYSRHFTGRKEGEAPPTLLEYFPKDFLCIIDESHVTVPQIGGMYRGDRSRKETLVNYGFRLPSALDNRPLHFTEFKNLTNKVIYVSATPGNYELEQSNDKIIQQVIRPTGLLDPAVEVRPASNQIDNLLEVIKDIIKKKERVLVTTLTKKSSESLQAYYENQGLKVKYLHSEIKTVERTEIIRELRLGVFDVLIGINLLREGLDIPEVSLVAILDADKEGFLRSERSLIQIIGRAARNINGKVILYADTITKSMKKAMEETQRRRHIQERYNVKNNITPKGITKAVGKSLLDMYASISSQEYANTKAVQSVSEMHKKYEVNTDLKNTSNAKILKQIVKDKKKLKIQMQQASKHLEFEEAALLRDQIKKLEVLELKILE